MQAAADHIRRWRENPHIFVREVFGVTPDAWQDDVLAAFPAHQRQAMKACKGPGKAQPKSIRIYTPDGERLWGDLKSGDRIFALDGSVARIVNTYERGILPMFRVAFDDGSSTLCCGEHLWRVQGRTELRHNKWAVLSTEEIIRRGITISNGEWKQKQFRLPLHGAAQFTRNILLVDPYMLGVWLGDGSSNRAGFTGEHIEVDNELIERGLQLIRRNDGHGKKICVAVAGLARGLRKLGIFHLRSHERFIPEVYKTTCISQRKDVLSGLMDTDGCVGNDGHMEFNSTSRRLAEDVVYLVRSLGGNAHIKETVKKASYKKEGIKIDGRPCYRVTVVLPFNPFKIHKKAERWRRPQERYLTRYIASITRWIPEEAMCIEIDHPDSCYLTNDFIVTHNTAILAWLAWNFLLTRPYPKIAATSITGDNLADNLWTEMAKWQQRSVLLKGTFTWTKTRIFANDHPETWWMSARPWSKSANREEQGQTLAGLHADYIMFILDESGGIPDAVMASAEAALSSCVEGHLLQAGNPTHLEGPLYRACTSERRLWHVTEITADPDDPKRTARVKVEWARDQIEKYGRDNPWVLINVFGRFPPSSLNSLIGPDEVREATKRYYRPQDYGDAGRVLGVDVAREGLDSSVIFPRQGIQAFPPLQFRNIDGTQGAGQVARKWEEWDADACFIDNTGGFGSSWIDNLLRIGKSPIGVHFSEKPANGRYHNKRTEMAFECIEWVKRGGGIPDIPELMAAMTQTTYTFSKDKLLIEPKEGIKEKLGYSPDHFDSLMLTFAYPVTRKARVSSGGGHEISYSPLGRQHIQQDLREAPQIDYQALRRR